MSCATTSKVSLEAARTRSLMASNALIWTLECSWCVWRWAQCSSAAMVSLKNGDMGEVPPAYSVSVRVCIVCSSQEGEPITWVSSSIHRHFRWEAKRQVGAEKLILELLIPQTTCSSDTSPATFCCIHDPMKRASGLFSSHTTNKPPARK
eukprot:1161299-Pelagomonas_calceolata.AAC.9